MFAMFKNLTGLWIAFRLCPVLVLILVGTWFLFPFVAASIVFPSDVVRLGDWLQGQHVRPYVNAQSLYTGFGIALAVMALMALIQLNVTTLIYRKAGTFSTFWPAGLVLIGVIANGIWWLKTGYFDFTGALIGFSPCLSAIAWQMVCEKLGGRFVFGR